MSEQLPTWDIRHEHINIEAILEGSEEVDDERMVDARQNVSLRVDMFDLSKPNNLSLAENLHGEVALSSWLGN
jgi:hypothetical protein